MSAFALAARAMFRDRNMAVDALYKAGGEGAGVTVRVIKRAPDRIANFTEGRFVTDTILIDFLVSEVADPATGDSFTIGDEVLELRSEPVRDSERLIWAAEARVYVAPPEDPAP
jgi:hypothetical protein